MIYYIDYYIYIEYFIETKLVISMYNHNFSIILKTLYFVHVN